MTVPYINDASAELGTIRLLHIGKVSGYKTDWWNLKI